MNENTPPNPGKPFSETDSSGTIFVVIDEPGDTTIRPRRPHIPLEPPPPRRPQPEPPDQK
jgi:hypothetical protein